MQLRLLPKKVEIYHKVRLDWLMIPTSLLAGDMLNYFRADVRHLVFYLLEGRRARYTGGPTLGGRSTVCYF
jgi:hypothetical protein